MKVRKILKFIGNILFYLILAFLIYTSFSIVAATKRGEQPEIFGYKFYVVLTGSMKPNIEPGDLIVTRETEVSEIECGDIITFKVEGVDSVTTHRVKEIIDSKDGISFLTQGDANNIEDKEPVEAGDVQGRVVKVIPDAGKVVDFMKNNLIIILAIIIAVFVLIIVITSLIGGLKKSKIKDSK